MKDDRLALLKMPRSLARRLRVPTGATWVQVGIITRGRDVKLCLCHQSTEGKNLDSLRAAFVDEADIAQLRHVGFQHVPGWEIERFNEGVCALPEEPPAWVQ